MSGRARLSRSGIPLSACRETHDLVLEWLGRLPPGRLLDCPAGQGALAVEARQLGWQPVALDLGGQRGGAGLARVAADLNRPLPFAAASFDAVACVEGIEHLERPADALREFRRVLKPGGTLIITTPNTLHLASRVTSLLSGYPTAAPAAFDPALPPTGYEHIMLLSYPMLAWFAGRAGFRIGTVTSSRVVGRSLFWLWLAPLVWFVTRLRAGGRYQREMARTVTSRSLLFGHTLCIECRAT